MMKVYGLTWELLRKIDDSDPSNAPILCQVVKLKACQIVCGGKLWKVLGNTGCPGEWVPSSDRPRPHQTFLYPFSSEL